MKTINEQIKNKSLSPLHLIYGEERYMVRYLKHSIIKSMGLEQDEMNYSHYEGNSVSFSEIMDVALTLPFFAEKRLIIIEDSGYFKAASDVADQIEALPDTTCMVFIEKEVDKRNRLYKYISKQGLVTEVQEESQQMLVGWVAKYLKRYGKNVTQNTVIGILDRVGTSMELLANELDKLISYVGDKETVEMLDVEAVCTIHITGKIFEMIDAVASKQQQKALHLYHDLLSLKEPPARILFLYVRQVNIMLQVKELEKRRMQSGEIASKIKIPPFAVKKYSLQARNFTEKQLMKMLSECAVLEEAMKTGRISDQIAVEVFLIQYASKKR